MFEFEKLQESVNFIQSDFASTNYCCQLMNRGPGEITYYNKGVSLKKNENLYSIIDTLGRKVNYSCHKAQVSYISRVNEKVFTRNKDGNPSLLPSHNGLKNSLITADNSEFSKPVCEGRLHSSCSSL